MNWKRAQKEFQSLGAAESSRSRKARLLASIVTFLITGPALAGWIWAGTTRSPLLNWYGTETPTLCTSPEFIGYESQPLSSMPQPFDLGAGICAGLGQEMADAKLLRALA